jgi:hypothetical protein
VAGAAASALDGTSLLERLRCAEERYRRLAENAPDMPDRIDRRGPEVTDLTIHNAYSALVANEDRNLHGEGFDDSRLDTLFLTMPISWRGTLRQ